MAIRIPVAAPAESLSMCQSAEVFSEKSLVSLE